MKKTFIKPTNLRSKQTCINVSKLFR